MERRPRIGAGVSFGVGVAMLITLVIGEIETPTRCLRCSWSFWLLAGGVLVLFLPFAAWIVSTYFRQLPRLRAAAERREKGFARQGREILGEDATERILGVLRDLKASLESDLEADSFGHRVRPEVQALEQVLGRVPRDPKRRRLRSALARVRAEVSMYAQDSEKAWESTDAGRHPRLKDSDRERLERLLDLISEAEASARA
jgi:hypothetical protein